MMRKQTIPGANVPTREPRGFAILIILAVIATASVIIATQLTATEGQDASRIRTTESLKARAVAERCVEIADALVEATGDASDEDFDRLLDPDNTIDNSGGGDDYLPPSNLLGSAATTVVSVPPSETKALYRYRAYEIDPTSACFVRFDDNFDDANLNLPAALDDPGVEGLFVNVPQRDRDRTIIITSIGVSYVAGTPIASAYAKAHAVATVKRLRAMPVNISDGLAVHAGGDVFIDRGSICGDIGGITADSIDGDLLCVCGVLNAEQNPGVNQGNESSPCPGCTDCANGTGSSTGPGSRPDPPITVPPRPAFMANETFGKPGSSGNNIGAGPCVIYTRDDDSTLSGANPVGVDSAGVALTDAAQVFVWDKNDIDVGASMDRYESAGVPVTGEPEDLDDFSCALNTSDPVPKPCTWRVNPGTKVLSSIECEVGESPCWKLVAHLGDADGVPDFDPVRVGNQAEQASTSGSNKGNHFTPKSGTIPNVVNNVLGTAPTWNNMCGGCTSCTTGGANTIQIDSDHLRLSKSGTILTAANFPSPAILVFETANPDAALDADAVLSPELKIAAGSLTSGGVNMPRLRIITNGGLQLDGDTKLCDPDSICPEGDFKAITQGACASDDSNVLAMEPNGFAIIAGGNMETSSKSFGIVGRIDIGTLDADNNDCFIGDLIAHDPGPGVFDCDVDSTTAPFCSTSSTICFKNTFNLTGDVFAHGNICMKNNGSFSGSITTEGSVAWKNNGAINGQIKALGDVVGKNNNTVTFNGDGASAFTGAPSEMWMESSW